MSTQQDAPMSPIILPYVFLITPEDAVRSAHIEDEHVGHWCIVINGCLIAACDSEDQARSIERRLRLRLPRATLAEA